MKLIKRIAAVIISGAAALSCYTFSSAAEEDIDGDADVIDTEDEASEDSDYITSGDYKYSVKVYDDGSDVAFLEEYTGDAEKVEIPEEIDGYKVKGLGNKTFYLNDKITEITISENLADFGYYPFYGCTSLMEFKVNENNPIYTSDSDGALVGKDGLAIMAYPTGKNPEKYTLADGIVAINSSAFAMCSELKEINFPDSLEYIGNFVFSECTSLESITFPDSVSALGKFVFSGCTSLKDVTLPANLQKIGDAAFYKCESLELIDFPITLTEIGQAAFASTGMTSIKIPPTITAIGYSAFGFYTNENDEIILDEDFVVMGYEGSYAQTYCQENEVTFLALDEDEAAGSDEKAENQTFSKRAIILICIGGVLAVAAVIAAVIIIKKRKSLKDKEDGEEESEENNYTEDE